jgi:hypothetical protein
MLARCVNNSLVPSAVGGCCIDSGCIQLQMAEKRLTPVATIGLDSRQMAAISIFGRRHAAARLTGRKEKRGSRKSRGGEESFGRGASKLPTFRPRRRQLWHCLDSTA